MIKISLCRDLSREPQTKISTCYSQSPSLHLKGDWLKEAGFDTGCGVTVKISQGCIVLMADNNEVQELREELYKVKQVVKGMRDGVFSVLNGSN
ncbi:type I toxin-antitoxin system SymE family toxin [Salmonella enterica]